MAESTDLISNFNFKRERKVIGLSDRFITWELDRKKCLENFGVEKNISSRSRICFFVYTYCTKIRYYLIHRRIVYTGIWAYVFSAKMLYTFSRIFWRTIKTFLTNTLSYTYTIVSKHYVQSTCSSRVCEESNHRETHDKVCSVYLQYCTRKL